MKIILGLVTWLVLTLSGTAQAGVILAVSSAIQNTMGELNCCGDNLVDMFNQEGLSSNYVSGVTDFNTFTSSGVTHSGGDSTSWLSGAGVFSGFIDLDLGAVYNVENFVMWNGASGIDASVNGFSLTTSLLSDFSVSTPVGNFVGQQADFGATVYDMTDTLARYVRFQIDGNFGNGCCTAVGEIAFDVTNTGPSVPEPAGIALLALGLTGFAFSRRKVSA